MFAKKFRKALAIAVVTLTALFVGGTATVASALSVDVTNFHYSDDSGRSIGYNFSTGTVGTAPPNAILLDGFADITRPAGETGTNYFWGQAPFPAFPPITVTLDTTGKKATVSPVNATNGGVAVLFVGGPNPPPPPPPAATTSWFFFMNLSNFNVDLDVQKVYEFDIGLGRDESAGPYNNATLNIIWVKGQYNGVTYADNTLIVRARVQNGDNELWASTPIVRTGLDPAATTLMFDLSVEDGTRFFAAAGINDEGMTNLGEYTLTTEQGFFQRLPALFPYLFIGEQSASTGGTTGGTNLLLTYPGGHPPYGFTFATGEVAAAMGDFVITGYGGNQAPYSAYGFLTTGVSVLDLGAMTTGAFDAMNSVPQTGYQTPAALSLVEGHAYAFHLADGSFGALVVRSVTLALPAITMAFDYKHFGGGNGGPNPSAYAQHWSNGYYVQLNYQDPAKTATAVTVTGPGITGTAELTYNTATGSWNSWTPPSSQVYFETLPTGLPLTYTFSITDTSTWTATSTVSCFQVPIATNLSPTGSVTGTPTFSWTGIADSGVRYGVELNDDSNNRVWSNYEITGTSIVYPGPALTPGVTYNYLVSIQTSNACSTGASFAQSSFTYSGTSGGTISFSGMARTPSLSQPNDSLPVAGAVVQAREVVFPLSGGAAYGETSTNDQGIFTLSGIPAIPSVFRLVIPTPSGTGYIPVLSQFFSSAIDIQALLPYILFTPAQYNAFGNAPDTGMIRGRVALRDNPASPLAGATIVARAWTPGDPPVLGDFYPVTYTSGTATQADGIYMVKNVPTGTIVQLVAMLANHTFEFNPAPIVPVASGFVSEASFFATAGQQSPFNVYSYHNETAYFINMFVDDPSHAFTGVTVNGPGLEGEVSLGYVATRGRWEIASSIGLGSTLPTGPRTYNFTATTSATPLTGSKTVSVYVEGFAGALQPTGDITAPPVFSWTGIAGGTGYAVVLNDLTAGTGVWNSPNLAGSQTSFVYSGPALIAGHTYEYTVISSINTDGNSNSSFARAQFTYTGGNNLLQNGGFSGNLNGWIVNPALRTETAPWPLLGDGSGVTLHPNMNYGFNGTILYQNLNLTNVAGKTLSLSIKLTNLYGYTAGNTVSVWLTYVDGIGNLVRTKVLSPANSSITSGTIVTGSFAVPAGAQKIVKLELVKEGYGSFNADDVVLWADGVTSGPTPSIAGLSAPSGAYGTTLTINGANFGTTQGSVKIGGMAAAVVSWTNTAITVSVASPVRSGSVVVIAGGVESNPSQPFQVTSPYFTVDLLNQGIKVIKGQKGEYLLKTTFFNNFTTTAGIGLQFQGGDAAILSGKTTFIPVPIKGQGGVVLKIDTADLAAGSYTADIVALNGSETVPVGTLNLQVVTVSDIRFYEMISQTYPNPSIRVDLPTTKSLTTQGQFYIYQEVVGSDGQIFTGETGVVLSEVPTASPILGIFNRFWGYELYAQNNGTTQLRATAPDGTVRTLGITVSFPLTSWVSAIGLYTPTGAPSIYPLYNNRTAPIYWLAQGTTRLSWIGYDTSGMMNFGIDFLEQLNRSQDGLSASSTFTLQNTPTDIGTAILHVQTDGGATAAIPLTTVNAPGTGLLSFYIKSLDPQAFAEMFQISFYGTDNQLKFSRDVFAMHVGTKPVLVGNIPPGTYKILFAPGNTSVKPQWWPNAADISGAEPLVFAADATVDNIYFFAQPQPMGAMITLPTPPIRDFTSTQAGTGSLAVTASDPDLFWIAVSSAPWITITSGVSGVGSGTVNYAVAANPYGASRTGTITVAGQAFTITQAGTGIIPPYVGVWGAQQLIHFDPGYDQVGNVSVPWYAEVARTTLHEDGTGIMVIRKNDHNGELIEQIKPFTYTMAPNADGSLAMSITMDGQTMTQRLVVSDGGRMAIMDGTAQEGQQKLMVLYRIDPAKSYSAADLNGEYYNVGFERNNTGVADPPLSGNGRFMAISGIHTFNGAGTYTYYGTANSVKIDGSNLIWVDDQSMTNRSYAVSANGTMTAGGGAFQGWFTGNGLAGGGGGAFQNGLDNQVAYFFLKKGDRPYSTADLAGKWAIVSFGQDSKTTVPASEGFSSSIGTMICDTLGQCSVKLRDRWSGSSATTIATDNLNFSVASDGSFGAAFGGQSPAYAGVIGNNGNTVLLNASFKYPAGSDPYHREILIAIRASNIGDLAGGTAFLKGDVNGDGRVDMADAVLALKVVVGMSPAGIRTDYTTSGADINGDGMVGRAELIYILQYLGGLRQ